MKILQVSLLTAALLLSGCAKTPDTITSNKHDAEIDSGDAAEVYVSPENIYDSFDAAFKTEYSKFQLSDKSTVNVSVPEGVYDLEISYINAAEDTDWMAEKIEMFHREIPGFDIDGEIVKEDLIATLEDEHSKIKIEHYSRPYFLWECSEYGVNMTNTEAANVECVYLNRSLGDDVDSGLLSAADKAKSLADSISEILGDELENMVYDGYILTGAEDVGYEIDLQKGYKGVGIQNLISTYSDESLFIKGDTLMSVSMQTYVDLNSDFEPQFFIGCDAFEVAKAEPIEKMISFKGACDVLEKNLATEIDVSFDDVRLMYEPRGTEKGFSETAENIRCTPKWYFIIDDKQSTGIHSINYITVDCVTGEMYVLVP